MNDLLSILRSIEKRPVMYFGSAERARSIRIIQAFIIGFQVAQLDPKVENIFDCFTEWVAFHYNVLADGKGSFEMILEHSNSDERKAYDEFFSLLPKYVRDRDKYGVSAIRLKFLKGQDVLWKKFREEI